MSNLAPTIYVQNLIVALDALARATYDYARTQYEQKQTDAARNTENLAATLQAYAEVLAAQRSRLVIYAEGVRYRATIVPNDVHQVDRKTQAAGG